MSAGTAAPALGVPPALWVCGAVVVGCALGPTRHDAWLAVTVMAVIAVMLASISRSAAAWTVACVLLALGGSLWRAAPLPARSVHWPIGAVSELRGQALTWPTTGSTSGTVRAPLRVTAARTKAGWQAADATLIATLPNDPAVARGDAVFVIGTPRLELSTEDDGIVFARTVRIERKNTARPWEDFTHAITSGVRGRIEANVRMPEAGLLVGMLLGEKTALDAGTRTALSATGATHFIVVDGGNIALVAGLLAAFGRAFGARRRGIWALVSLAGIVVYALAVGADPPVIRATTMGAIMLLAPLLRRRADPLVSLGVAAAGMALWNPAVVATLSFLVSLTATIGVLLVAPWLHTRMERVALGRLFPTVTEMFAVALAVHLTTGPVIWYGFGQVSIIAPVMNVVLEPLAPPLMALGTAIALLGFLPVPFVASLTGMIASVPAWLFLHLVRLGAALPLASFYVPQPGVALTLGCYLLPLGIILARRAATTWHGPIVRRDLGWGIAGFALTLVVALLALQWAP